MKPPGGWRHVQKVDNTGKLVRRHDMMLSLPAGLCDYKIPGCRGAHKVGVWDLVARGYFIPGGASQTGVVGRQRSVSHVVGPGQGSGLMGLVGSCWV